MREQFTVFIKCIGLVLSLLSAGVAHSSESMEDLNLTKEIRSEIVNQGDLSQAAKNIVIVTKSKTVTLSGTVATQDEKEKVEEISKKIAGSNNVHSRITVKSKNRNEH